MSVPSSRMVARTSPTPGDPNKIMGVPKTAFWIIVAAGAILAFYIVRKSGGPSTPTQQETFPETDGDWAQDSYPGNTGGGAALGSAGLPNIPGTNANPNPEPIADPSSQTSTYTTSPIYTTYTATTVNPYNPNYSGNPTNPYIAPPTQGSGGAYTTGSGVPNPGGGITGRGIQGGP